MMLAATIAGIGFGNAGVHVPHACAYPIASLKHAWTPRGLPGSAPLRAARLLGHGDGARGLSLHGGGCPRAPPRGRAPARGRRSRRDDRRAHARLGAPASISELGYTEDDIPALAEGALKQQRLLVVSPREVTLQDLERILRESL